jgi:hypothetical protein
VDEGKRISMLLDLGDGWAEVLKASGVGLHATGGETLERSFSTPESYYSSCLLFFFVSLLSLSLLSLCSLLFISLFFLLDSFVLVIRSHLRKKERKPTRE